MNEIFNKIKKYLNFFLHFFTSKDYYKLLKIHEFGRLLQNPVLELNLIYFCKNDFDLQNV